jgi:hypothetical protein
MLRQLLLAATLVAAATSQSAFAGTLRFAGATAGSNPIFGNKDWSLALTYTAGAGPTATITAATLLIDTYSFSLKTSGVGNLPDTITVAQIVGLNDDEMTIAADFQASVPGAYGSVVASLTGLKVEGKADITGNVASDANLQLLGSIGNLVTAGTFLFFPNGVDPNNADSVTLSGAVPAPEPGSFALLAGLALVAGRRFLKLRKCRI